MNFIDRAIEVVAPVTALRRAAARKTMKVLNYGYGDGGASHEKKSMKGWRATANSPQEDIDWSLPTLRARCRDLWMNAPIARSALGTTRTNVVGSGLRLKSRVDVAVLGLTEEQADAWEQHVEREFGLWADSVWCDALRLNDFYEMQQLAQLGWLMNGDSFCVFKVEPPAPQMPYALRLHLIEADRVSTPNALMTASAANWLMEGQASDGNRIVSGVEIDKATGATVAYHICSGYPATFYSAEPLEWQRVEAFGKATGERMILHLMESERAEQRRGVPFLAPVIESLKQITRYTEAELMAAVVSGMFTVFVKSAAPSADPNPMGNMLPADQQVAANEPTSYELGNGAINILQEGESIELANPARPNANFAGFVDALCAQVGAALEVPKELLLKQFNSSYSASRAALLEAWKMFRMRRAWLANDYCQPVYERWLAEAVARGRVSAPGFWGDPLIRKAWCRAEWNGPAQGQLDPVKEVNAAAIRVQNGFSTRERETMEINGGDFDRNVRQLKRENQMMSEVMGNAAGNADPAAPTGGTGK